MSKNELFAHIFEIIARMITIFGHKVDVDRAHQSMFVVESNDGNKRD